MIDRESLAREGLPIVEVLVRRFERQFGGMTTRDELLAVARPALFEAIRTFDPERSRFAPYATNKIKWAVLDTVRRDLRRRRLAQRAAGIAASELLGEVPAEPPNPMASEAEHQQALTTYLARRAAALVLGAASIPGFEGNAPVRVPNPEDVLLDVELRTAVRSAVDGLPEQQRTLVERYYFGEEKFESIASDMGVSKSWASRLHHKALSGLADRLRTQLRPKAAPRPRR